MPYRKQLGREEARQKLRHYCAYQERCHQEVRDKAYSFGLRKTDVEELVAELIQEDYLNEQRFASAFAGGRFRLKHWGRTRIRYELRQRQVSEYCITRALREIDEEAYQQVLGQLAEKKLASLAGEPWPSRDKKTFDYLLQKGYEPELIRAQMENVRNSRPK